MTNQLKRITTGGFALGLLLATATLPALAGSYGMSTSSSNDSGMMPKADIVDTAISAGDFSTLVTALKAAGLVATLKGPGPFTVFAPTDAAFAKIPKADLNALLANKEALTAVLTYHVVPGKVMSSQLAGKTTMAKTVQGDPVNIDARYGVKVNGASVIKADITTSNGVIHVIDTVIMPPNKSSAIEADDRMAYSYERK